MRKIFLLGLTASMLNAATQVVSDQTLNFDNLNSNLGGRGTGSGELLTIPQFNLPGTLNSVTILVESYLKYQYSVTNNENNSATSNFGFVFAPTVTVNGQNVAYVNTAGLFPIYPPGSNAGVLGPLATFTSSIFYDNTSDLNAVGSPLGAFIGGGTVNYTTTPSAIFVNDCSGDCDTEHISRYGVRITVTYDYTRDSNEVPEPASLALIGGGLIAFALYKRRA